MNNINLAVILPYQIPLTPSRHSKCLLQNYSKLLEFAASVLNNFSMENINKIEGVQKRATKVVIEVTCARTD